ncbi:hypothetical protein L1857_08460 [Amycolatopsis thermalba]|uniref:Uncharacterized protein n=1 Tax=Amycolatopsis thermalba TaxID=944492 RepID=A0ABY4NS17_9PSEU|nr:hypothetical protein L1857_08460 [Amycolatopsis thermalba]
MVMHAAALLRDGSRFDDVLDALKEVFVDQGLVAAFDLFVLVRHVAEVVAIPQHLRELVDRHLLGRVQPGGARAQSAVVQLV